MKQALGFRLGQQLAMTPRMRQAIRLLQLSTLELRGELGQLVESNYMLETDDETPRAEWGGEVVRGREARDTDSLPEPEESLRERLYWQLNAARFTDEDHLIGTVIIDSIDESGYLEGSMDELLAALEHLGLCAEPEEVEAVLQRVQRFEPPGVAARSLSECLLRQLEETAADTPHRNLAMRVARHHLEALARHDHAGLARRLETTRGEVEAAHALLRTLKPRPGAGYAGTPTEYVTPDLGVFRVSGAWRVELNADAVPRLRINPVYAELARRSDRGTEAASLRQHLTEARWLIRSLANRAETLLRVARVHRPAAGGVPRARRGGDAAARAARHRIRARPARIDRVPRDQPEVRADAARRVRAQVLLLQPGRRRGGGWRLRDGHPRPPAEDHRGGGTRSALERPAPRLGPGAGRVPGRPPDGREVPGIDGDPSLEREAPGRGRRRQRQRLIVVRLGGHIRCN